MIDFESGVVRIFGEMQESIIRRTAQRISKMDFTVSESSLYEMERLIASGAVFDDAVAEIAKAMDKSKTEVYRIFSEAGLDEYMKENGAPGFMAAGGGMISAGMYHIIRANADKLNLHMMNLTRTTAYRWQEDFIHACDRAYSEVVSGTRSVDSAVMEAVREVSGKGTTVQYPSGHVDTVDVAARRAVRTSVSQTEGQIVEQYLKDYNHDLVDTSAHAGARMRHVPWQGRRFSYSGNDTRYPSFFEETEYGDPAGLKGYNCRHSFFPAYDFMPPAYSEAQLKEMAEASVTYNGEKILLCDANQMQRAYERKIRRTKRELIGLDELRLQQPDNLQAKAEFDKKAMRLKKQRDKLSDFLKQTGLKQDHGKEWELGFDRSLAQKAVWGAKRELTKQTERDIIKEIRKIKGFTTGDIHLKPTKIDVTALSYNEKHVNIEHERNISKEMAISFIKNARISITKRNGITENYFGTEGAAYVNPIEMEIKTAYAKDRFDENVDALMEVLNKYGI